MDVFKRVIAFIIPALLIASTFPEKEILAESSKEVIQPAFTDNAISNWEKAPISNSINVAFDSITENGRHANIENNELTISKNSCVAFSVNIPSEEEYYLVLSYRVENPQIVDTLLDIEVDNQAYVGYIPTLWTDKSYKYETDRNGDEILPDQITIDKFVTSSVEDYRDINRKTLIFKLSVGQHEFALSAAEQSIKLRQVIIAVKDEPVPYDDYIKKYSAANDAKDLIIQEAERYSAKSESYIRGKSIKNPALYPYNGSSKVINILNGGTWSAAGQKVLWEFEVKQDGLYQIGIRYSQDSYGNKPSYRTVEIDGTVPFEEFNAVDFPATDSNQFENYTLADSSGDAYKVYLTSGVHTISMSVSMGPMEEIYHRIKEVMDTINSVGIDLKCLSAGSADANRTWDMNTVLPDAVPMLKQCAKDIDAIYEKIMSVTTEKATFADSLIYARDTLNNLLKEPRVLPNKTDLLNIGDNSVSKYLGTVLSSLTVNPLGLDRIYVFAGKKLPASKVSFFKSLWEGITSFFNSFISSSKNTYAADITKKDNSNLTVWVNRSIQYTEALQRLADKNYNRKNNTDIRLSIMPSEQKLILANASGTNPDVALGVAFSTPFDFAIRGAAKNLLDYKDFLSFYNSQYNIESLIPMSYNKGVYGVAETQDFQVFVLSKGYSEKAWIVCS